MKKNFLLSALLFYCLQITYSQSGQLDPTFGDRGIAKADIGSKYDYSSAARQVFLRPDGSMYVVSDAIIISRSGTIVSKLFANGSIDSAYGFNGYSRSVYITDAFSAIQADGKIVITGSNGNNSFAITRVDTNGIPDSTFGNNGIQTVGINPRSLVIQNDGRIVVAGYAVDEANNNVYFGVVRYDANGSPDNTLNGSGQVLTDFVFKEAPDVEGGDSIEYHNAYANTVAIQADGKIVVGGFAYTGTSNDFAIARYTVNGVPDSTFNGDGKQTSNISSSDDAGNSLAIQSDGKIILAGYVFSSTGNYFAIARYNANGSPDNSFSGDGKQTANLGSDATISNSVAIQSDGKIVIAGYTLKDPQNNDFALVRFNVNGSLDNSFDTDGKLTTDFGSSDDYAGFVALQSDGKIVVAGYTYDYLPGITLQRFALVRYNDNGSLDISFDKDGKLQGDYNQGFTDFNAIAIANDGKVIAAGQTWNAGTYSFAAARFNIDGTPDSTFSEDGKIITDFGGDSYATAVAVQADGKIIIAGNSNNQFSLVRYNIDGSPDNTFGGDGKVILAMGFSDICRSLTLQKDGRILVAGYTFTDANYDSAYFALARLNTNGTPDNTFDQDGKQLTDFGTYKDFANAVAIQSDGKIVVAGRSYINNSNQFSLARYNTNGSLDTSFSNDGKQNNLFGSDSYFIQSLAIENDGNILVAGHSETQSGTSSALAVARYTPAGELDNTFSDDGFQTTFLSAQFEYGKSIAVNTDGKIAVGGTNDNFAVVLYNNNGSVDNTFSDDGIQITNIGTGGSSIQALAFADNKLYAAGYAQFPGTLGVVVRYLLPEGGPLPVSQLNLKGMRQNTSVALEWKITTDKRITGFTVERSADANRFMPVTDLKVAGISPVNMTFYYTDLQPFQTINFYRLKVDDFEGRFTYSNIIAVKMNGANNLQVFPNPAKDVVFVQAGGNNENATVDIIDATGRNIKELKVYLGINTSFSIDVSGIRPGMYQLVLRKKEKTEVQTLIKQ